MYRKKRHNAKARALRKFARNLIGESEKCKRHMMYGFLMNCAMVISFIVLHTLLFLGDFNTIKPSGWELYWITIPGVQTFSLDEDDRKSFVYFCVYLVWTTATGIAPLLPIFVKYAVLFVHATNEEYFLYYINMPVIMLLWILLAFLVQLFCVYFTCCLIYYKLKKYVCGQTIIFYEELF